MKYIVILVSLILLTAFADNVLTTKGMTGFPLAAYGWLVIAVALYVWTKTVLDDLFSPKSSPLRWLGEFLLALPLVISCGGAIAICVLFVEHAVSLV